MTEARKAMEAHIDQTYADYEHYIGHGSAAGGPGPAQDRGSGAAPGHAPNSTGDD